MDKKDSQPKNKKWVHLRQWLEQKGENAQFFLTFLHFNRKLLYKISKLQKHFETMKPQIRQKAKY